MIEVGQVRQCERCSPEPLRLTVWKIELQHIQISGIVFQIRLELISLSWPIDVPELSPRELAVHFTDDQGYFVSESSVYRLLKACDLITSPAFIVMKAANEFKDKTTAINQLS